MPSAPRSSPLPFRFAVEPQDRADRPTLRLDGADPATGRRFLIDVTDAAGYVPPPGAVLPAAPPDTPALLAAVLDADGPWQLAAFEAACAGPLHYHAHEWLPSARVVRYGPDGWPVAAADVAGAVWYAALERPSAVYAALRALAAEQGMEIAAGGWSFGGGPPIYRASLAACVRAVANALTADVWLQPRHPERTAGLPPHPETWTIMLDAERALAASPSAGQFRAGLAALAAVAPDGVAARVTRDGAYLRVSLDDWRLPYPNFQRVATGFHLPTGRWGGLPARGWGSADAAREPFGPVLEQLVGAPVQRLPDVALPELPDGWAPDSDVDLYI